MNEQNRPKIEKHSKYEKHAELFSAFSYTDDVELEVFIPSSENASEVRIEIWIDDLRETRSYKTEKNGSDGVYDCFSYVFDFPGMCTEGESGLFYYHFVYNSQGGERYVSRCGEDLLPVICHNRAEVSSYQLTVYPDRFKTPDSFKGGIMYQIFTDRFNKGSVPVPVRPDAVINPDWYSGIPEYADKPGGFVKNNMFFGGTLYGITEKLDYLKSLGVTAVYLNPIFEAYSNHKYDIGDYMKIDDMFGGERAFDMLLKEAEKRGIKIILDGVFNHTGSDSVYFNKNNRYNIMGAYNSPSSEYSGWYIFDSYPDKYRSWWGIDILPKLNGKNPGLRKFLCGENGVIRRYLKKGVYGWRLDVADELDSELLEEIRRAAKSEKEDSIIIGEVWEDASNKIAYDKRRRYFRGDELDSVMNYPLRNAVVQYLSDRDAKAFSKVCTELYSHYPKCVSDVLMNFLGTHDTERILSVLGGDDLHDKTNAELASYRMEPERRVRAVKLLQLAYVIISTMPGVPCIYYGDEAGLEGGRDPFNRGTYPWGKENGELIEFYKKVGKIRRGEKLFEKGYFRVVSDEMGVIVYERFKGDDKITVVVNPTDAPYEIGFEKESKARLSECTGKVIRVEAMKAEIITVDR